MKQQLSQLHIRQLLCIGVLAAIVCSLGLYLYSVNQSVQYIVTHRHLKQEVTELRSKLGTIEFRYIDERNSITLSDAKRRGYTKAENAAYISAPALGQADRDAETRL